MKCAIKNNHLEIIELLLQHGIVIDYLILDVFASNNIAILKLFLENGYVFNYSFLKCFERHIELAKFLIEKGYYDDECLLSTIRHGHLELVKLLFATGVQSTIDPMICAVNYDQSKIVLFLLKKGYSPPKTIYDNIGSYKTHALLRLPPLTLKHIVLTKRKIRIETSLRNQNIHDDLISIILDFEKTKVVINDCSDTKNRKIHNL